MKHFFYFNLIESKRSIFSFGLTTIEKQFCDIYFPLLEMTYWQSDVTVVFRLPPTPHFWFFCVCVDSISGHLALSSVCLFDTNSRSVCVCDRNHARIASPSPWASSDGCGGAGRWRTSSTPPPMMIYTSLKFDTDNGDACFSRLFTQLTTD